MLFYSLGHTIRRQFFRLQPDSLIHLPGGFDGFIIRAPGQDNFCGSSVQGRTGQNRMDS